MKNIVADINESYGIITEDDMTNYEAPLDENPDIAKFAELDMEMVVPPAPSGGPFTAYCCGVLFFKHPATNKY